MKSKLSKQDIAYLLMEVFMVMLTVGLICSTTLMSLADAGLCLSWLIFGFLSTNSLKGIALQFKKFFTNSACLSFSLIYFVSIIGLLYSANPQMGVKELWVKVPILLMPLFFSGFPKIKERTIALVMGFHCATLIFASVVILYNYIEGSHNFRHYYPFISHIRLSLNYCLSILTLLFVLIHYHKRISSLKMIIIALIIAWFLVSILLIKTLTGFGALLIVSLILLLSDKSLYSAGKKFKLAVSSVIIVILCISVGYYLYAHKKYYNPRIDVTQLEKYTINGNPYTHDIELSTIEEGNYDYCYLCESELRREWNKVSSVDYDNFVIGDSIVVKYPLTRYMTSLSLRKDSVGVHSLTQKQINDIEHGVANVNYTKLGIYSRLSAFFFSNERFKKTNDPSGSSILQRICAWKTGLLIIKNHPLFGVGTGAVVDTQKQMYEVASPKLQDNFKIPTHNQFIFFTIQSGIIGLFVFLFGFIYPGIKRKMFTDTMWKSIFFLAFLSMFFEDTLGSQAGVTFVTFFYFLLLYKERRQSLFNDEI